MLCTARHFCEPVVSEGCLSRDKQFGTHDQDASTPWDTQLSVSTYETCKPTNPPNSPMSYNPIGGGCPEMVPFTSSHC